MAETATRPAAKALHDPAGARELLDWGAIAAPIEGLSTTRGLLIHKDADGANECGVWECTPGTWACHVTRAEFCHFLAGRCTYRAEDGSVLEIVPGTAAFFPEGWQGTCTVHETVRKVYMIR
jgi:uncharacterized cupin superfamily protein